MVEILKTFRVLLLYLKCMSLKRLGGMVLATTLETHLVVSGRKIRKPRKNFNMEKIFLNLNKYDNHKIYFKCGYYNSCRKEI